MNLRPKRRIQPDPIVKTRRRVIDSDDDEPVKEAKVDDGDGGETDEEEWEERGGDEDEEVGGEEEEKHDEVLDLLEASDFYRSMTEDNKQKFLAVNRQIIETMTTIRPINDFDNFVMSDADRKKLLSLYLQLDEFERPSLEFEIIHKEIEDLYADYAHPVNETETRLKALLQRSPRGLKDKILTSLLPDPIKAVIYDRHCDLLQMEAHDPNRSKLENWIKMALKIPLPHPDFTLQIKLAEVKRKLDEKVYGLHQVKEEILTFLASYLSNPSPAIKSSVYVGIPALARPRSSAPSARPLVYPFARSRWAGLTISPISRAITIPMSGLNRGSLFGS